MTETNRDLTLETPGNIMWNKYNGFAKRKLTGSCQDTELKDLEVIIVDLLDNGYKLGKISEEDVISARSFIPEENMFKLEHKDLKVAASTADLSFGVAGIAVDEKKTTVSERQKGYVKTAGNI